MGEGQNGKPWHKGAQAIASFRTATWPGWHIPGQRSSWTQVQHGLGLAAALRFGGRSCPPANSDPDPLPGDTPASGRRSTSSIIWKMRTSSGCGGGIGADSKGGLCPGTGPHLSPACTFYLSAPDRTCQHLSPVCTCSLLPTSDTCLHRLSPDNTCHLAQVAHICLTCPHLSPAYLPTLNPSAHTDLHLHHQS